MQQIKAQITVQPYRFPKVVREVLMHVNEQGSGIRTLYRYLSWDEFKELHQLDRETTERLRNRLTSGEDVVLEGLKSIEIEVRDEIGELP